MQTSNDMVIYEYPLNEKIRLWLRFNRLFDKFSGILSASSSFSPLISHWDVFAFKTLFEMIEIAEQSDLRSDLLRELERFRQFSKVLQNDESIDQLELEKLMDKISKASMNLRSAAGRPNHILNSNPWLSTLRGRMALSGGYNEFDIPSFHWWRNLSQEQVEQDLRNFQKEFHPIEFAIEMIVNNIRDTAKVENFSMTAGNLSLVNIMNMDIILLRLFLPADCAYFPEFSASRHQVNIRMLALSNDSWETHKVEPSGDIALQQCVMPTVF